MEQGHVTSQPFRTESLPKGQSAKSMSVFTGLIKRRYIYFEYVHDYHGYKKIKSVTVMIDNMTKLPNNQVIKIPIVYQCYLFAIDIQKH